MADRVDVYARALLDIVSAEGHLDEVEDELFRFARIVEGNDDLRMTLANPGLPARPARRDRRRAAREPGAADHAWRSRRSSSAPAGATTCPRSSTGSSSSPPQNREHAVAEVRSAVALDDAQTQRIAEALSRATGKQVEVKVVVDESVLGGIVATIGDTVIDGTVRHRLDQLKEQI